MTVQRQAKLWLVILGGSLALLWLLGNILLPFVLGMAIAYFLDPVVDRLQRWGWSRTVSALLILVGFFFLSTLVFVLLLPTVVEQVVGLVARLPQYFSALFDLGRSLWERALSVLDPDDVNQLKAPFASAVQRLAELLAAFLNGAFDQSLKIVNVLTLLSVTPLVAFYLLRDWPRVLDAVDGWLPLEHAATIREQARAIDVVLAGYVRGVATVCLTLGAFYAVALTLVGLNFGLTIGLIAGGISFIPYVGTFVGLVTSVGVAAVQFWPNWVMIAIVLGVFFSGQVLIDYVLTPRLVGDRIGLHPLWVIFGLFAGGALFGFLGILLAMPVCAAIGVLMRFAIAQYKESELYLGAAQGPPLVVVPGRGEVAAVGGAERERPETRTPPATAEGGPR
ncbi:MAG: AI-2E family transporter [Deltaproteobacteria bacterium]|nr:AI-2E family transporter [Deltaproteobacteria bacterium]